MMQPAVRALRKLTRQLDDAVNDATLEVVVPLVDALVQPLSPEDIAGLIDILPANGDTAFGINWTILHAVEASPFWPLWDVLDESVPNEWVALFLTRLKNGGYAPPKGYYA